MTEPSHELLVTHTFGGRRFDSHRLDVTVLPELVAYRTLLVECARSLWRTNNPARERLPGNYEESIVLSISKIRSGSVAVPIERQRLTGEQGTFWGRGDEVDQAVLLIADAVDAAAADRPLPSKFPKGVLPTFEGYGKSLRHDEWFEQLPRGRTRPARYNAAVRDRLTSWASERYESAIDLYGTVTMARVSPPRFALKTGNEVPVEASFEPDVEAVILAALHNYRTARVRVTGRGAFSGSGQLTRITHVDHVIAAGSDEFVTDRTRPPIWAALRTIMADVPDDDLMGIPQSSETDNVLYGAPETAR